MLANRSKLKDTAHLNIGIKPDRSREECRIESILLRERRNLIASGVDCKSIRVRGNSLVVNQLKFSIVTDKGFQLCAVDDDDVLLADEDADNSGSSANHESVQGCSTNQGSEPFLGVR